MSVDRSAKLSSLLTQKLSEYMRTEMELPGIVSISHIDVAPNMQSATVWISIYGADEEKVLQIFKGEKNRLRSYLTKELVSKYTPKLRFKVDPSEEHADKISRKLKELE